MVKSCKIRSTCMYIHRLLSLSSYSCIWTIVYVPSVYYVCSSVLAYGHTGIRSSLIIINRSVCFMILHAATDAMLEKREIITDSTSITFLFKIRSPTPLKFIFNYKCRQLTFEDYYKERKKTYYAEGSYVTIRKLYPGSQCEIDVTTLYHPGSLDPGLPFIVNTYLSR